MTSNGCKVRVGKLARGQFGRVTFAQVQRLGVASSTIAVWAADGYLEKILPRVYAVGHLAADAEADLMAAALYAGPGAALSHATAAWWLGLIDEKPRSIQVSTPRSCRSRPGIRVYPRRKRHRFLHKGIPVTSREETLIDLAATAPRRTLRKALANADYQGVLDLNAIEQAFSRGLHGATKLRAALAAHRPDLANAKSRAEIRLVEICETENIQVPVLNTRRDGWELDAYWPGKLVVELDGYGNHHTPAQLRRDRRKEMAVRAMGLPMIRYSEDQLKNSREAVVAELRRTTA